MSTFAKIRARSCFYKRTPGVPTAYGTPANSLRPKPKLKASLQNITFYADQTVDLREKNRLDLLEAMRHPKERDFYQDHTFHEQFIQRDMEKENTRKISQQYRYFSPWFQKDPWLWYPGDVVEVVRGSNTGQRGTIIAVVKYKNELIVQNVNVKDITLPATETRPEQIVQREHPITVDWVRHVDPTTQELCDLSIVKVKNKDKGDVIEYKRISMSSGVLLPIPPQETTVEAGDPIKDTPMTDADEVTYNEEEEMKVLVAKKLQAIENYFVESLRKAHHFHGPLQEANYQSMMRFQRAVLVRATDKVLWKLNRISARVEEDVTSSRRVALQPWWFEHLAPLVAEQEVIVRAEKKRQDLASMAAAGSSDDVEVEQQDDVATNDTATAAS